MRTIQQISEDAVKQLAKKGYQATTHGNGFVCVLDPVKCSNGLTAWTEYEPIVLDVTKNHGTELWKFFDVRGHN